MKNNEKLDQGEIDKAKGDVVAVIGKYLDLKKQGRDYFACCPFHSEKSPSFTVSASKNFYQCFGCGSHGDAVDFVMAYEGIGFREAVASINGFLPTASNAKTARDSYKQEQIDEWEPMVPVPDNLKIVPKDSINRKINGEWVRLTAQNRWAYKDQEGQLIGYIYRFDLPNGGKEVIPQTYCVNKQNGECEWRWVSFTKPRPIYGLDKLAAYPKAQVIIVEGEKAADAGQLLYSSSGVPLEKLVVISWPGGGKAVKHTDWTPLEGRSVGLWPDADSKSYPDIHPLAGELMPFLEQPGTVAMLDIYEAIGESASTVKFIVPPVGVPDGWDLADPAPEGFSLLAHTKAHAMPASEVRAKFAVPEPEPEYQPQEQEQEQDYQPEYEEYQHQPEPTAPVVQLAGEDEFDDDLNNNGHFSILGYDGESYFIFHRKKKQVMEVTKGNFSNIGMIEIAHPNFWEEHFPKKGGWNNEAAAAWFFNVAHSRGIYDPKRVRGRGAWIDKGRHVFHHGDVLTIDGVPCAIDKIDSAYVYSMGASMPSKADQPLTDAEGRHLLQIANIVRWTRPASGVMMAGFCMLAPICGALKWRPHIWITGGAGSGKTSVQRDFVGSLTRDLGMYFQGNSTEPGIRQNIKADAVPVLIDELESNTESDKKRVEAILAMIRQASSESQAKTAKGTAHGAAMTFHIRSMFCLSSINTNLGEKADIDRLTALVIKSPAPAGSPEDKWAVLSEELHKLANDETLSRRLLARCLAMMPVIHENIAVFIKAAAAKFGTQRYGDQFGTLAAGAWCLLHSTVATAEQATKMLDAYDWNEHTENLDQDDATKALESVLSAKIKVGTYGELSVYELVRDSIPSYKKGVIELAMADDTLRRHGIRVDQKKDQLIFGTSISSLRQLVEKCSFVTDLRGQLLRIPGATRTDNAMRFNGSNSKCVTVPLSRIMEGETDMPPI